MCTRARLSWLLVLLAAPLRVLAAAVFNGGGLDDGVNAAQSNLTGSGLVEETNLLIVIAKFIKFILPFAAAFALTVIVIAGFILILGLGSDTATERAKKIIFWALIGLFVILLAYPVTAFIISFA